MLRKNILVNVQLLSILQKFQIFSIKNKIIYVNSIGIFETFALQFFFIIYNVKHLKLSKISTSLNVYFKYII